METPPRKVSWTTWAGLWMTIALVALAFLIASWPTPAPQAAAGRLPVYSQLGTFTLTNQLGQPVTLNNLTGQVWVADIIFTRCPGPCARMSRQMAELQAELPAGPRVKLVSLTTDPDFDHPEVLQKYAARFGARAERWSFLTGTKPELRRLAVEGLKFTAIEKQPEQRDNAEDLFIHSTIFALVDKQGRLRAVFETQPAVLDDSGQVESDADAAKRWADHKAKILAGVQQLLAED
jgi:protein SCO1/2